MTYLSKVKSLSARDASLILVASVLLPITALLLRVLGVRSTRQWLSRLGAWPPASQAAGPDVMAEAQRVARMVHIAARHGLYSAPCLARSLVVEMLLDRRGISCEVKFGVRTGLQEFAAHAWVEADGHALAEPGARDEALQVLR